jgi:hypothetical protein
MRRPVRAEKKARRHCIGAFPRMVFLLKLTSRMVAEGGQDLNERPDKQIHPEHSWKAVAISLISAKEHARQRQ